MSIKIKGSSKSRTSDVLSSLEIMHTGNYTVAMSCSRETERELKTTQSDQMSARAHFLSVSMSKACMLII